MEHLRRSLQRPAVMIGLLLMLALAVAACGNSSSEGESAASTSTTAVVATTTTTVVDEDDHDHDHEDEDHDHEEDGAGDSDSAVVSLYEPRRLLVVAAYGEPTIDLIDIEDGSVVTIDLESPAAVSSSITESGRFLLAGHEDSVTVVDTGVWSERHGDHFDHYTTEPAILGQVDGPMPTHLISHGGLNALYFDGTGVALVITEEDLESGEVTVVDEVPTSGPHHGFALPTHDAFFVTVPTDDMEQLPNVVGISGSDGVVQAQFDCPATHGEASLATGAAAGCTDGVVIVTEDEGSWTGTYLSYPQVDDEDPFGFGPARAWILQADSNQNLLAAPHGARHLLVADSAGGTIQSFDLGRPIATLGVKFTGDGHLIVLTQDGFVHLIEPEDGSIVTSLEAIAAFNETDPAQPFRQMAISGDHAYVTDPSTNQIVEIGISDVLIVERTIDLEVVPGFLTIANG